MAFSTPRACGTPAYVAPEVIGKKGYEGAKADLWSCGVILLLAIYHFRTLTLIMAMYRKIYRGDFKCPSWFSSESRKILKCLLDPNPTTRIITSKPMQTGWFKREISGVKGIIMSHHDQKESCDQQEVDEKMSSKKMNAFHIISLSEGFDLSPLFEERRGAEIWDGEAGQ